MTEKVSRAFVDSQNVNPLDFLTDGETPEKAKIRINAVVAEVVQKGLSMRDGELHFGVSPSDMADAKTALTLLKQEDTNYMRHSNDGLMNAAGMLLLEWSHALMLPPKAFIKHNPEEKLPIILRSLDLMYEGGLKKHIQPRRWDNCGRSIGKQLSRVSAQQSMAPHR